MDFEIEVLIGVFILFFFFVIIPIYKLIINAKKGFLENKEIYKRKFFFDLLPYLFFYNVVFFAYLFVNNGDNLYSIFISIILFIIIINIYIKKEDIYQKIFNGESKSKNRQDYEINLSTSDIKNKIKNGLYVLGILCLTLIVTFAIVYVIGEYILNIDIPIDFLLMFLLFLTMAIILFSIPGLIFIIISVLMDIYLR